MTKQGLIWVMALVALLSLGGFAPASGSEEEEVTGTATDAEGAEATSTAEESPEPTYRGDEEVAGPFFDRARRAYDDREYEEAARLLQEAFELHEHPLLAYNIAVCHRMAMNWEAAVTAYRQYLQLCPRDELITDVYISIGDCLLRLDRREEANEAFQHYLDLERDGEYAGQAEQAIEGGEAPSDQDRRDPQAVRAAQEVCNRAAALWEEDQFEQAALLFLRGYERMPEMHEFLYNAGLCYLDAQAWGDAARTFSRYVRTPGAAHDAWVFLAECSAEQFDFWGAVEAYERYLELEPHGTYAEEARAFISDTMPAEGEEARVETGATPGELQRARELVMDADDHYAAERYQEALDCHLRAYEIVPARTLLFNIALTYETMERWAEAVDYYEQFLRGGDGGIDAVIHLWVAQCLMHINRPQEAARHVGQYLALADEHDLPNEESERNWAGTLRDELGSTGASD